MTKAKVVYYKNGEIVDVFRGNYSGGFSCCGDSAYGARSKFQRAAEKLQDQLEHSPYWVNEPLPYDKVELYKRNRAGKPRELIASVSVPNYEGGQSCLK